MLGALVAVEVCITRRIATRAMGVKMSPLRVARALIVLLTLLAYAPAILFGDLQHLNVEDDVHLPRGRPATLGAALRWCAFEAPRLGTAGPLGACLQVAVNWVGASAAAARVASLACHLWVAVSSLGLCYRLGDDAAAAAAAVGLLVAAHPLHAQAVAWARHLPALAAAGFALLKTGQLIGSNLKEKAVPALGKQEAKAREKAAGGYVAPKQAAAATVIDEKKAAAKAASDSAELAKSKSATASNDADAILAASSFVGASDLDKARLRRALRTIASTQKATSVSTSASAAASTSVPAGYVNNEQERKIYEMKRRSKELGTLNEFLDKYGPPDEVYGRANAEKAVERQAAELIAPGNVTWKPRETWLKVILWDCVCYPLQVPFLFLAWALGFSWGANPPPPEESA